MDPSDNPPKKLKLSDAIPSESLADLYDGTSSVTAWALVKHFKVQLLP